MVKEMSMLRNGERGCIERLIVKQKIVLVDSILEESDCANISKEK